MTSCNISLSVLQYLFRYVSEWDPRKHAQTKGGYLVGSIDTPPIPRGHQSMRMTIETFPVERSPDIIQNVHPLILHLVKMGRGKREQNHEPVPNKHHWRLVFTIQRDGRVHIKNEMSLLDVNKDGSQRLVPEEDFVTCLEGGRRIVLGNKKDHLKVVILTPKQDAREPNATEGVATVGSVLTDRTQTNAQALRDMIQEFRKDQYMKQVRLKVRFLVDVGGGEWKEFDSCVTKDPIIDLGSKKIGALEINDAHPLKSCTNGGRKIMMVSEYDLAENTVPVFQVWDKYENRRFDQEELLNQVSTNTNENDRQISWKKMVITFLTPAQSRLHLLEDDLIIKLTLQRGGDGHVANNALDFEYVDHSDRHCKFCDDNIDCDGKASIPLPAKRARPGIRKKRMVQRPYTRTAPVARRSRPKRTRRENSDEFRSESTEYTSQSSHSSHTDSINQSSHTDSINRLLSSDESSAFHEVPRMDEFNDPGVYGIWLGLDIGEQDGLPNPMLSGQDPCLESIPLDELVHFSAGGINLNQLS